MKNNKGKNIKSSNIHIKVEIILYGYLTVYQPITRNFAYWKIIMNWGDLSKISHTNKDKYIRSDIYVPFEEVKQRKMPIENKYTYTLITKLILWRG